ncbi:MAG: protein kinase domain-containing protein [Anaerolineales bacterium]
MLNKTVLEKFLVVEQTGENDLFLTYNGKDTQTGLTVNVTAFKPNMVTPVNFLQRFESLAKAITKIESPHTVPMLDYGEVEGQVVIVHEGIEGQSLTDLVTGGNGLQLDIAFDIARQLGEYVEAIHQADVFQVVFDPEEILLSSDSVVRVTNLGVAQVLNIGELLAEGKAKAQPYHAPELLRGEKADPRTDFYSLGALLFQLLTGKELDANAIASDRSLIADMLPSRQRLGIPPEWDELVAKCLHPVPAKRIQSAAEFMNRVTEVQRGMAEGGQATIIGMEDSLVGQTLGAYRLVERLGQGGMATVYKGYEAALDRYVAVKVLPQFFASDPNFTQRFRREAKAVAQLNHPNIITIYSYGEQSGITYLVMQFVEGGTLKHERGQTHSPEEALRLLLPIARALGYAHGRGIVHRDIKPSNVLMAEGNWPMLADFGLAQMAESSMKLTGSGVGLGTPMYMSPEQGRGDQVDARTDIYSLGIMLYELVTGDVPFRADTPMAIVIKHMTAPMPMPRQLNPNIPAEVENIILKSTAKDSDDRYQTAGDMATAMERVLNRLAAAIKEDEVVEEVRPTKIKPERLPPVKQPGTKKVGKTSLIVILSLIGLCLLGVILMGVFDICPPVGPWPQPPWCPGSPYKLPSFGGELATSVPTPMITEGTLGPILFQDDFDGEPSMRWDFQPRRWDTTTMDGRTVLLSDTSESNTFVSLKADGWTDYAVQFDFKFLKPDEHNAYYFYLRFRATDCPPTVKAMDDYVTLITTDVVELRDESCETQRQEQVAQSDRNISGEDWHTAQVIAVGNRVRLLIDGEGYLDYTDSESPHLEGGISLDLENNVGLAIDNFRVNEIIPGEATITSTPIPAYITEGELGEVLFEDDFETDDLSRWTPDGRWEVTQDESGNSVLHPITAGGDFQHIFASGSSGEDYSAQLRFKILDAPPGGGFHSQDPEFSINTRTDWGSAGCNRYQIVFESDEARIHRNQSADCPDTMLKQVNISPEWNLWHTARVDVRGMTVTVYLDGQQIMRVADDEAIWAGGLGLEAGVGMEVYFDDVSVTALTPRLTCEPGETELFSDDFESGDLSKWHFQDEGGVATGPWAVAADGSNHVLVGSDHNWASMGGQWQNYTITLRVKRRTYDNADVHLNSHISEGNRYYLNYWQGMLSQDTPAATGAHLGKVSFADDTEWHTLALSAVDGRLEVRFDGESLGAFDGEALPPGGIGIENIAGSLWYDDVLVCAPAP